MASNLNQQKTLKGAFFLFLAKGLVVLLKYFSKSKNAHKYFYSIF